MPHSGPPIANAVNSGHPGGNFAFFTSSLTNTAAVSAVVVDAVIALLWLGIAEYWSRMASRRPSVVGAYGSEVARAGNTVEGAQYTSGGIYIPRVRWLSPSNRFTIAGTIIILKLYYVCSTFGANSWVFTASVANSLVCAGYAIDCLVFGSGPFHSMRGNGRARGVLRPLVVNGTILSVQTALDLVCGSRERPGLLHFLVEPVELLPAPFEPLIEKNVVDKTSGTPAEEVTLRFGPWFVFRMTINKSLWNRLVLSKAKKSLLLWLAESTVHHPDSEDAPPVPSRAMVHIRRDGALVKFLMQRPSPRVVLNYSSVRSAGAIFEIVAKQQPGFEKRTFFFFAEFKKFNLCANVAQKDTLLELLVSLNGGVRLPLRSFRTASLFESAADQHAIWTAERENKRMAKNDWLRLL